MAIWVFDDRAPTMEMQTKRPSGFIQLWWLRSKGPTSETNTGRYFVLHYYVPTKSFTSQAQIEDSILKKYIYI